MSKSKIHSVTAKDWDQQEVLFAVRKRSSSFPKLAREAGYDNPRALYVIFYRKNAPKAQKIVADFLGLPPEAIWPSRYQSQTQQFTAPAERPHVRVA